MSEDDRGTREWLGAGLALAVVLAGVLAVGLHFTTQPAATAPVDRVPDDVDYVGYIDPQTSRTDSERHNATLFALRFQSVTTFYSGPDFRRSYGVGRHETPDPDAVGWVVYFGRSNGSAYDARVVRAAWRVKTLVAAVERDTNATLSEGRYRGKTIYHGDGRAVAVLADETFAVGNTTAVHDAVAVHVGANESLDGPLRHRFEREDGFVRFTYRFRPETAPRYIPFVGDAVERVEYVGASYSLNGSKLAVSVNVTAAGPNGADAVAGILNAGITFYRFETKNASIREELRKVELAREGRVVRLRYESAPGNWIPFLRSLARNQPRA